MPSLAWPWLLLLLPLPWLFYRQLSPALLQKSALKVPFFQQLHSLGRQTDHSWSKRLRLPMLLLIWLLLLLAAARPQQTQQLPPQPELGNSFMLAIDLSNSTNINDADPQQPGFSRLVLIKQLSSQIIRQRPDDRFGLIFFASKAYLQSPLTHDHQSLLHWLDNARAGMAGDRTAIGDAIGLAIKLLKPQRHKRKTIIMITDGANNSGSMPPVTAAGFAADLGLTIHTIGIGGNSSSHPLDEPLLQQLAQLGGGQYLHIQHPGQLPELVQILARLEPVAEQVPRQQLAELYHIPLTAALLLSLLLALHNLHGYLRQTVSAGSTQAAPRRDAAAARHAAKGETNA